MTAPTRPGRRPPPATPRPRPRHRRRIAWLRLSPLIAAAIAAFADAWTRGDYAEMHALLTPEEQRRVPLERFAATYREAAKVATLSGVTVGRAREPVDDVVTVPVALRTRIFGTLHEAISAYAARRRRFGGLGDETQLT